MKSTSVSLHRYLFLHAALMFLISSIEGFLIFKVLGAKPRQQQKLVNTHLDGYIAGLWLAAIGASLDFSTLSHPWKRLMGGAAIIYSWVQVGTSLALAYFGISLQSKFIGENIHDTIYGLIQFVMAPSAFIAIILWVAGFLALHSGESAPATKKSEQPSVPDSPTTRKRKTK